MGICTNNCTSWQDNGTFPMYQADPDIAGIGNIMAYIMSAFIVLCLSATRLIFTISDPKNTNRFELLICKAFKPMGFHEVTKTKRDFWVPVIDKVVLGLSDQQLLTGLAVLIGGFWTHCSISVYHFALVNDLAWFSATVHLTTLSILNGFFLENPVLRNWRVTLMVALAILLVASTVMMGHYDWFDSWPYDAQCLFDDLIGNIGGAPRYWMCVNLALICIYYSMNIITLYNRPMELCYIWLEQKPMAARDEALRHLLEKKADVISPRFLGGKMKRFSFALLIVLVSTISWVYFHLTALIVSNAFSLIEDIFWFAFGVWGLIGDREIPPSQMNGNENAMTFGQIMPVLLLSSIVLVFREAYDDQSKKMQENQYSRSNTSQRSLVRAQDSTAVSSTASNSFEMSGGIQDTEDDVELEIPPPRRVDTEMGGRSHTSTFEGQRLQRRSTYPPPASLRAEQSEQSEQSE